MTYAGSPNEAKVKNLLNELDFTPYERKLNESQEIVLVTTEDFVNALKNNKQR